MCLYPQRLCAAQGGDFFQIRPEVLRSTAARCDGWVLWECVAGISFAESPGTSSPAESSESWFTETCLQECFKCGMLCLFFCESSSVLEEMFLHVRVTEECSWAAVATPNGRTGLGLSWVPATTLTLLLCRMQKWQWVKFYCKISLRLRRGPVLPVQSMDRGMCLLRLLDLMLVWAQALEIWHLFVVYDGSIARVPQPFSYFLSDSGTLQSTQERDFKRRPFGVTSKDAPNSFSSSSSRVCNTKARRCLEQINKELFRSHSYLFWQGCFRKL